MKGYREFDKRYLNLESSSREKDYFSFVLENADSEKLGMDACRVLEVGCARGDFAHYIYQNHPLTQLTAIDVHEELIVKASKEFKGIDFRSNSLFNLDSNLIEQFDITFILTVHSLFENIELVLEKLLETLKPGGELLVFGLFNPVPLDIIIKIRDAELNNGWQTGWNSFAQHTVSNYLNTNKLKYEFIDYDIKKVKHSDDAGKFSSWTQKLEDGSLQLVNGAQIIHNFALLKIHKPFN